MATNTQRRASLCPIPPGRGFSPELSASAIPSNVVARRCSPRSFVCQQSSRTRSRPRHAASAPAAATAATAATVACVLLLLCNCCLLIPCAVFLGAPLIASFGISVHLHNSSDSSYQRFQSDAMPSRQMIGQILFAWDSPHFYSSRLGHLVQPQIPQFHVSSLTETSSRCYRFGSVGIRPNSHLGGHAPVCHHRLHSKSLCCTRDDFVILGFRRAQRTRRLRSGPLVDFLSGSFAQSESTCTSTLTTSSCFHDPIAHVTFSTPFKYLPAFFSLFQLL